MQAGINDVFEDAKKHNWILHDGWQLKAWLLLLPFTDHPAQFADTVAASWPPAETAHKLRQESRKDRAAATDTSWLVRLTLSELGLPHCDGSDVPIAASRYQLSAPPAGCQIIVGLLPLRAKMLLVRRSFPPAA
jgi:hypothetical protein